MHNLEFSAFFLICQRLKNVSIDIKKIPKLIVCEKPITYLYGNFQILLTYVFALLYAKNL